MIIEMNQSPEIAAEVWSCQGLLHLSQKDGAPRGSFRHALVWVPAASCQEQGDGENDFFLGDLLDVSWVPGSVVLAISADHDELFEVWQRWMDAPSDVVAE